MEDLKCHICGNEGYKSDGNSKIWCQKCLGLLDKKQPIVNDKNINRNEICSCGSGKKYKRCCI